MNDGKTQNFTTLCIMNFLVVNVEEMRKILKDKERFLPGKCHSLLSKRLLN